jgi:hypothetical protein
MRAEEKVTSLELSKALKEAGARRESEWCWELDCLAEGEVHHLEFLDIAMSGQNTSAGIYAAFDTAELLELLQPKWVTLDISTNRSGSMEVKASTPHPCSCRIADTPAEALGKLYLWCLKEGHCEAGREEARRNYEE